MKTSTISRPGRDGENQKQPTTNPYLQRHFHEHVTTNHGSLLQMQNKRLHFHVLKNLPSSSLQKHYSWEGTISLLRYFYSIFILGAYLHISLPKQPLAPCQACITLPGTVPPRDSGSAHCPGSPIQFIIFVWYNWEQKYLYAPVYPTSKFIKATVSFNL